MLFFEAWVAILLSSVEIAIVMRDNHDRTSVYGIPDERRTYTNPDMTNEGLMNGDEDGSNQQNRNNKNDDELNSQKRILINGNSDKNQNKRVMRKQNNDQEKVLRRYVPNG